MRPCWDSTSLVNRRRNWLNRPPERRSSLREGPVSQPAEEDGQWRSFLDGFHSSGIVNLDRCEVCAGFGGLCGFIFLRVLCAKQRYRSRHGAGGWATRHLRWIRFSIGTRWPRPKLSPGLSDPDVLDPIGPTVGDSPSRLRTTPETRRQMVVHHPRRLHERVTDRRAHKPKSAFA